MLFNYIQLYYLFHKYQGYMTSNKSCTIKHHIIGCSVFKPLNFVIISIFCMEHQCGPIYVYVATVGLGARYNRKRTRYEPGRAAGPYNGWLGRKAGTPLPPPMARPIIFCQGTKCPLLTAFFSLSFCRVTFPPEGRVIVGLQNFAWAPN